MLAHWIIWRRHLRAGHTAAALLSELMGYTALAAGLGGEPARHRSDCCHAIIGYLTAKIDNRWLIAFGFSMFGAASLWFGEVNLSIGSGHSCGPF